MRAARGLPAFLLVALSACAASSPAGESLRGQSPRETIDLGRGWRFLRAPAPDAIRGDLDDSGWQAVDLPHTWNAVDGQDGGNDYHRGVGWYRKRFRLPAALAGRRLFLEFDGAGIVATAYLNGRRVGSHSGSYARFHFDVTRQAIAGDNLLAVEVDNAEAPHVAPLTGADFTYFGGLHRGVRLLAVEPLHIEVHGNGGPGVYLTQRRVTRESADVEVWTVVRNDGAAPIRAAVEVTVRDAAGRTVLRARPRAERIAPGRLSVIVRPIRIERPRLWNGAADPHVYRVEVRVRDARGRITDAITQPLGLRFFHFDPARGFSLNGGPYRQLRGVGLHQDRAGRGSATTPAQQRRDLALIARLGADAVRLTHYQHAQATYDEADRLGLVVWTEVPVINRIDASPAFALGARQQLKELISQNYNHPSVIMWGIANEPLLHEGPDPLPLLRELDALARRLDSTRPTVLASHLAQEKGPATHPSHEVSQLLGFNAYHGWYYGSIDDLGGWIRSYRRNHPGRAIALSEVGAGAGIERHAERPAAKDLSEEYQALFLDRHLATAARSQLWGTFIWVFADFAADHRTDSVRPGINDKGLVTRDRAVEKDSYHVVRAHWSREPVLRIASRRFHRRAATVEVAVITNLERVELRVNGVLLPPPARSPGSRMLRWTGVRLKPGDNQVEAIAQEGRLMDRVRWRRIE
ncbi:MAG TPA: glycoside hydrolase family 2 TIM barrel-domain containing protein [Kofleriaceae bacterium]|nr:glycoside hydrolase family 2 TIM barrel-domain containing protein [Kofleriaceae bacterium]